MEEFAQQFINRIKSPIFGYFLVSFIAINWDPIFYLFFHTASVPLRINYFKESVDFYSAFAFPFLISIVYSIAYPWINFLIGYATNQAVELRDNLSIDADHRTTIKKRNLEEARSELFRIKEEIILERAAVDQKINEIDDENTREELKVQLTEIRKPDSSKPLSSNIHFPEFDTDLQSIIGQLLVTMAANKSVMLRDDLKSILGFSDVKNDVLITELIRHKYIDIIQVSQNNFKYSLTSRAKKVLVDKKLIN